MAEPLLAIRDLKTYFVSKHAEVRAVDGIDIDVQKGQIVCIVGESGCGKSMTSLSIMRLVPKPRGKIVNGEILFDGKDLLKLSDREMADMRGSEISMIFQEPMTALNPVLTIGTQISEILIRHRGMNKRQALDKAVEMLKFVGVPRANEIIHEFPHQLSGGLRQRVMIAMAMICEPKLLIADEPTTALDVTIQAQVLELMKKMRDETGTAIIMITHDLGVVADMADHVVVMYAGQVVESVDADTVFEQPKHPYTRALMDSIPSLEEDKDVLYSIPGTVPSAANFPKGCRFAERCPLAQPSCFEKAPELREVAPGHLVRCDLVS
ncbi:oligopeptide/dipeptide ABC transporter, ATPase subunit [Alicyclobacillus hesperidum URH17-3-68]|uniref:Dipeptide/oligopeptide/nickel ABC transporter ATP-binding protein n=1 Tax=Alicyclobacillus hesperidum TaxID=89784 RepID=A0A1H2QDW3_9BACL|nr:ABC transporter ATP-binding protein [Alicyclobacillus hesperidum]EJY54700.1 oligopeptide/dipeptide ABC transporter, ATPase subunit [Alicyclobacillus hesperidum URH17-3-68]KRW92904.1 peptide ABC transporter ATP-binding protein [Alicyclobacillus tengchongensis]GLV12684.1 dipeptide/oligopeptide/nickel ABC transporter ATP-binding protein [Alicyclobacillus hesperidum]SDW05255.1 peptide/nickel transport system ATP-binding protein [Alicyclobacillus hesperidum]